MPESRSESRQSDLLSRTLRHGGGLIHRRRAPPGSPPGTLVADPAAPPPKLTVISYDGDKIEQAETGDIAGLKDRLGLWPVTWINVDGLGDASLISELGETFGLHRLAIEDVINVHQRPKVEEYDDHIFIVTRMVLREHAPESEQVSIFLGKGFVITFQERTGDCFDPVRKRLRQGSGLIRLRGADYLAYALLDAVIDNYYPVLEEYGERIEEMEIAVTQEPDTHHVGEMHGLKRELLNLRRALWPQREMIGALLRDETPIISADTVPYLRDCYDHVVQLMDVIESYREVTSGLVDVYLSSINTRMNEVIKVLTIIATIFIPLSFVASVYGMNFATEISPWNMPELHWAFGYPFALGLMIAIALGLLIYFRRKGWLGGSVKRKQSQESSSARR